MIIIGVIIGIVSRTITVLLTLHEFPELSIFLYSNRYVHAVQVVTEPLVGVEILPVPSTLSDHIAHDSV